MDSLKSSLSDLLRQLYLLAAALAVFATGVMFWKSAFGVFSIGAYLFGAVVLFSVVILLWWLRGRIPGLVAALDIRLHQGSSQGLFVAIVVIGLLLRLAYIVVFPAQPSSDEAVFIRLANQFAATGQFGSPGAWSFWPPGYPLFLTPIIGFLDADLLIIRLLNLVFFVMAAKLVFDLGVRWHSISAALAATLLLALWPNYIASVVLPSKEAMLIVLLLLALRVYPGRQQRSGNGVWRALGTGLILGFATLVQPALQLVFLAFLFTEILHSTHLRLGLVRVMVLAVGMFLVLLPWTARNYVVHEEFVLLTTNGGVIMNMTNQDGAPGHWYREGAVELDHLSELEANREGFRRAKQWIAENPAQFLGLAFRKQVLWLGDDSISIYASLSAGLGIQGTVYVLTKLFGNAYWALIWLVVLASLMAFGRTAVQQRLAGTEVTLMLFLFFYMLSVHSVLESGSKYHVLLIGVIALLNVMTLFPKSDALKQTPSSEPSE